MTKYDWIFENTAKHEPAAPDYGKVAELIKNTYDSLVNVGFKRKEAWEMTKLLISNSLHQGGQR